MGFIEYLWDKKIYITATLMADLAAGFFLKIIGVRNIFILFLMVLWIMPLVVVFCIKYFEKNRYYKQVFLCMEKLLPKSLLAEVIEKPDFLEGKYFYDMLKISQKYMNDTIAKGEKEQKDYKEFIELWVHEIKNPITALELKINRIESFRERRKLEKEVRNINQLVEKVLYYARSNALEKDFFIEKIALKDMVEETVKDNSGELIQERVRVEMQALDQTVYADKKWIKFILSQLILNSVKYKKEEAKIVFWGEREKEYVSFFIQDNGIGIKKEELEQIFEKGFTGSNGRATKKSTGMGLYLCKKMCSKMNLSITAESKEGEGCTMQIKFPVGSFVEEV